jgi:hypothetical protein
MLTKPKSMLPFQIACEGLARFRAPLPFLNRDRRAIIASVPVVNGKEIFCFLSCTAHRYGVGLWWRDRGTQDRGEPVIFVSSCFALCESQCFLSNFDWRAAAGRMAENCIFLAAAASVMAESYLFG